MYAACLRFYEIVPQHELESIIHQVYGPKRSLEIVPGNAVFCPKIICVVSRMPFYRCDLTFPRPHFIFHHLVLLVVALILVSLLC